MPLLIHRSGLIVTLLYCFAPASAQEIKSRHWFENLPLTSFRLPPPPLRAEIDYEDLDGDGDPDILRTVTRKDFPVQWIDDDDDMREGDWTGDTDSDCLMVDRNRDGEYGGPYDLIVDWNDEDGDGMADMQVVADQTGLDNNKVNPGHYMIVIDTDYDQIFNYIDWNTFELKNWKHSASSRFFTDYRGKSLFMKIHAPTFAFEDLRLNWENPFLFYDPDDDGQTEMAIRMKDSHQFKQGNAAALPEDPTKVTKAMRNVFVDGIIDWVSIGLDLDNDNAAATEFDFDMSLKFTGLGFDYTNHVHPYKSMRGLAGTADLFYDARFRQIGELVYPDHEAAWDLVFQKGDWQECWLVFDEDDDCHRWERVEFYEPKDLYKTGARKGGLDDNPQADVSGDRGEWDLDCSGGGKLYVGAFDGKIHLHGAEWGAWRIDQDATFYQGWQGWRSGGEPAPEVFAIVRYEDQDQNGFIDLVQYDLNGDGTFDHVTDFQTINVKDEQPLIDPENMAYEDFEAIFKTLARTNWQRAQQAIAVAERRGLDTNWYANFKQAYSIWEQYHFGFWLNFYLYLDLMNWGMRKGDTAFLKHLDQAYYQGDWTGLQ